MAADLYATLMKLFDQAGRDPDIVPAAPLDAWPEGSDDRSLLASFCAMSDQVRKRLEHLRQAEEQLREREEQYRSIYESTYDGLVILALNGAMVDANPAFFQMYGYTREELIGKHGSALSARVPTPPAP